MASGNMARAMLRLYNLPSHFFITLIGCADCDWTRPRFEEVGVELMTTDVTDNSPDSKLLRLLDLLLQHWIPKDRQ